MKIESSKETIRPGIEYHNYYIGPLELEIEDIDESILTVKPRYGLLSRDIENILTKCPYTVGMPFVEKIDYLAGAFYPTLYARAVEKLARIELPEMSKIIRSLLLELSAVYSHLGYIAQVCNIIGFDHLSNKTLIKREELSVLFEQYSGSRLLFGAIKLGGVTAPVTEGFLEKIDNYIQSLFEYLEIVKSLALNNKIFINRLTGLGMLDVGSIEKYGITGLNKIGANDCLQRFRFRTDNIRERINGILELMTSVESSSYRIDVSLDFSPPKGNAFELLEGPRGNISVYIKSDGGKSPCHVSFFSPSFVNLKLLQNISKSEGVEDLDLLVASLDICMSEVDK